MNLPAVFFGARRAEKDGMLSFSDHFLIFCDSSNDFRLVFHRSEEAVGKSLGRRPSLSVVARADEPARPILHKFSDFIEKQHLAVGHLKQHGVVARASTLRRRHFAWVRPARCTVEFAGGPNADVGCALVTAAKPRCEQVAVAQFNDGRGVTRGKRRIVVDEFIGQNLRLGLCHCRQQAEKRP